VGQREATGTGTEATGRPLSVTNAEFESNQERERREREAFLAVVYTARADGRVRLSFENRRDDDDGRPARASLWCYTPLGLSSDLYDALNTQRRCLLLSSLRSSIYAPRLETRQ
jgi:hypothetical protein